MDKRIVIKKYQKGNRKDSIRYVMKCLCCDCEFEIIPRDYNRGRGIYCSSKCNKESKSGVNNGMWNGGIKFVDGYKLIHLSHVKEKYHYLATHSKLYIPEHRYIASIKYKKKLTSKNIVHHLNGIRDDNRPENLVIVDSYTHEKGTFAKKLQKRIRELECK